MINISELPSNVNTDSANEVSPQLENGYTRLANELLEALYNIRLTWYELRLVLYVMRSTYGFQRRSDRISLTQFRDGVRDKKSGQVIIRGTGMDCRNICRLLAKLSDQNIITRTHDSYITEYSIQKDYTRWKPSGIPASDNTASDNTTSDTANDTPVTLQTGGSDTANDRTSDTANDHQRNKETYTKETNTKERKLLRENNLFNFIEECKGNEKYKGIDVDREWKFCQIWFEDKGKLIKSPRLALRNWLDKALEKKASGVSVKNNGHKPEIEVTESSRAYLRSLDGG